MALIIKRASDIDKDVRFDIADIFVERFAEKLKFYSSKTEKLVNLFGDSIQPDSFFVAMEKPDRILGILATSDATTRPFAFTKDEVKKALGFYKGSVGTYALQAEFEALPHIAQGEMLLECLAVRGSTKVDDIAESLVSYVTENYDMDTFWVDLAWVDEDSLPGDTVGFFAKLGFDTSDEKGLMFEKGDKPRTALLKKP